MIVHIAGTLVAKELDRIEVMTASGVGYRLTIPLSVFEILPAVGEAVSLPTALVVREEEWLLFGFASAFERAVFHRVLDAKGVGPALALGLLSSLTATRLVRAIREHDVATLQTVPRMGRKKAEQLILDLADKMEDLQPEEAAAAGRPTGASAENAVRALVSLGYTSADAERAVRAALDADGRGLTVPELIRAALAKVAAR